MVDLLLLFLFLSSGAIAGWLCFNLFPNNYLEQILLQENLFEHLPREIDLRTLLAGFGALIGLLAGFSFQQLRNR